MNCLSILLDTDKFELPQQNSVTLEAFWSVKEEILKHLKPIEGEIFGNPCFIIISLKPDKIGIDYIIDNVEVEGKILDILSEKLNLDNVAKKILSARLN